MSTLLKDIIKISNESIYNLNNLINHLLEFTSEHSDNGEELTESEILLLLKSLNIINNNISNIERILDDELKNNSYNREVMIDKLTKIYLSEDKSKEWLEERICAIRGCKLTCEKWIGKVY